MAISSHAPDDFVACFRYGCDQQIDEVVTPGNLIRKFGLRNGTLCFDYSLLISCLCLLAWGALNVFYSIIWRPKRLEKCLKQQGIQGTPFKLIYGDMKEFLKLMTEAWSKPMNLTHEITPRIVPFTRQTVQSYGNISMFWLGKTPRLILLDPELVKEVLHDKSGYFQKPPVDTLILILTRGLASLEGDKWAQHRKIINPAFQLEKLKGMVPAISKSVNELIERWDSLVDQQGSCEVDIWPELNILTANVISRTAFGSGYEEAKKIFQLQKEQAVLVIEAMQTLYIPGFRFLPTKMNKQRVALDKEIKSILRDIIQRKKEALIVGQSGSDDLLTLMLQSNDETNGLTIDEVIEECKQFYFAAEETTSSLLTWTLVVLAMHPNWQEKARKEVYEICGKSSPSYEAISCLKVVNMILHEVSRLYPPVIELYRHSYKAAKVGEMTLPPGVDLLIPILLIHHDRQLWGVDAEEFNPERFAQGAYKASKNHFAYFPFGWGPRICIGQTFALIEAKMALAMILQHFSFELSPSYTHAPYTVMTLQPQHGAQIILHKL